MSLKLAAVITTVQPATISVKQLHKRLAEDGGELIVVGDRKGPTSFDLAGATTFVPIEEQAKLRFRLASQLPENHYVRKNIGYLVAIENGAGTIYETDDDNAPNGSWGRRHLSTPTVETSDSGWVNAYRSFSNERIWPRGFPLDEIVRSMQHPPNLKPDPVTVEAPIQQGLADNSPDVDAVWRLVADRPFTFDERPSLYLPAGAWCPFNSQSTWWWPVAYPLMYLPSFCSFRMTDIWRSLIAQRCLWEMGYGVVFHSAEVVQERNLHDLMRDFADEVPGYLRNREIAEILESLSLHASPEHVGENLLLCYKALVGGGILPSTELVLVKAWLDDLALLAFESANS